MNNTEIKTVEITYTCKRADGIWRDGCKVVEASKVLTEAKKLRARKGIRAIRVIPGWYWVE